MLIIAGFFRVDPGHRDAVVAAHEDLQRRARQAPGCLDLAITADSLDPARVNNYERWESQELLDAWRAVANPPDTGVEIREAEVRMYTASGERSPFD